MSGAYPSEPAMQPAAVPCVFDSEEFADFESAHQFSITSEDWTLTELDEAALGIEQRPTGVAGGVKPKPEAAKKAAAACTAASPVVTSSSQQQQQQRQAVMKTSMLETSEDDLFSTGTARNYNSSFNKTRPTMISAKYRLKEERRKVLKISINKLKKIEDPESSLRRSVLINNTMKRLQKEAREERREKQQIHSFPRYTPSYKSFVLREEPPKPAEEPQSRPAGSESPSAAPRLKPDADKENASPFPSERKYPVLQKSSSLQETSCFCDETMDELVDVTSLDDELSRPLEELSNPANLLESAAIDDGAGRCASRKRSFDEDLVRPLEALMEATIVDEVRHSPALQPEKPRVEEMEATPAARKRSFEEVEDAEIHDVLSQFYMPPTPRMLTSIDDDEDEDEEVNVVDIDMPIDVSPISCSLRADAGLQPKVLGFDELVRDDLDLMDDAVVVASPCKRARFDATPLGHVEASTVAYGDDGVEAKIARPFGSDDSSTSESTPSPATSLQSYGYLGLDASGLSRTSCTSVSEVGSLNCGTVSTPSLASPNDECSSSIAAATTTTTTTTTTTASISPCARTDAEIKDMKNIDFPTKENSKMVDRRSQITRISEAMSWTSLMHESRSDSHSQDYKMYNNGLCKTLADCCYQEANNNVAAVEAASKYSCAHAAITELQSQVYHNYVTSLES